MAKDNAQIRASLYGQLLRLRDSAGANHHERVRIANRLLKDRAWVCDPSGGGGDEDKAITRLEEDCFADIVGLISLPQLLQVYHHVPDVADWKKHRFNLRKIWAEWQAANAPRPKPVNRTAPANGRGSPRAPAGPAPAPENKDARADRLAYLEEENRLLRAENELLKQEVDNLNARLRLAARAAG